jgi:hypothetical protein
MISWFRYVRHEDRARFEAEGWAFVDDLGPVHGAYSCLMEFQGDGDPNQDQAEGRGNVDSAVDARIRSRVVAII